MSIIAMKYKLLLIKPGTGGQKMGKLTGHQGTGNKSMFVVSTYVICKRLQCIYSYEIRLYHCFGEWVALALLCPIDCATGL
jgi:hypothetical protein